MVAKKKKRSVDTKAPPGLPIPLADFPGEQYDPFLLLDDEDWRVLEPAFAAPDGEALADDLAHLLARIGKAIESGHYDRALWTLKDGVRFCYLRSRTHREALKLYWLSFVDDALSIGEPLQLIEGAVARASKAASPKGATG
jgi:hypothetical protein